MQQVQEALDQTLCALCAALAQLLCERGLMLATAESCTGGMVAAACTDVAGASRWFERGFVCYSNASKEQMLGVSADVIAAHGAVSEPVARAMAFGAVRHSGADLGLSITGIAGPDGGSLLKPVGGVWFGFSVLGELHSGWARFSGDRRAVRQQAAEHALRHMLALIRRRLGSSTHPAIDAPREQGGGRRVL